MSSVFFPSTTRLDFEWIDETPQSVSYKLAEIAAVFDDPRMIAQEAKQILRADMREKFLTETDPSGQKWQELVAPELEQVGILRRGSTGTRMFNRIMSEKSWRANKMGVFIDTSTWPPYWPRHEQPSGTEGGDRVPRREFIAATNEAEVQILNFADFWLTTQVQEIVSQPVIRGVSRASGVGRGAGKFITPVFNPKANRFQDPATGRFVKAPK